jgi:hypothetical protein
MHSIFNQPFKEPKLVALKLLDQLGFGVHMQIDLVPLGKRIWKYVYETTKIIVMFKINLNFFK